MSKEEKKSKNLIQFLKFALVGLSNTIISYVVYSICYYVFDASVHVGNILGFILSVLNAYILQNKFVFKQDENAEKRVWWKVLLKTYASYAFTGLILSELLIILWLNVLHIEQYLGEVSQLLEKININMSAKDTAVSLVPFINIIFTMPINYVVNKFWAYRQKKKN